MKNKKTLGLLLSFSLVLSAALPGTFSVSANADDSESGFTIGHSPAPGAPDGGSDNGFTIGQSPAPGASAGGSDNGFTIGQSSAAPLPPKLPVFPAHLDTCVEGCAGEGCECPCHKRLYERLMACASLEEIDLVLSAAAQEEFESLTGEEILEIEAHVESLMPAPLPAVVIGRLGDEPVTSEIIYPTVSFTEVAPFGKPVAGGDNEGGRG